MARWLIGGAMLALALTLTLVPGVALADSVQVVLDGRPLVFDVPPVLENGVTMVPVRAVLMPLGASLSWSEASGTVTASLSGTEIQAVVGSDTARVDGQPVPLAMPVLNNGGRTLVPLRFLAERLGFTVQWEEESHTALLLSAGAEAPDTSRSARSAAVSREATRRVGDAVVAMAQQHIGMPYAWGGLQPETGFDCSGLTYYLAGLTGMELPRTSQEQFGVGIAVTLPELEAGDLVFFTTYAEGASHVGVYDGADGFIHAQSPGVGVVRTPMSSPWWSARYVGARRVFR